MYAVYRVSTPSTFSKFMRITRLTSSTKITSSTRITRITSFTRINTVYCCLFQFSSFRYFALIMSKGGCTVILVASLAFLLCVFSNVCPNCFPRGMHIHTSCICFTFSPLCVLKCTLKLLSCNVAKSHWLHLLGFSPLCLLKCFLKLSAREDA